jgi:hypothetical protein
MGWMLAQRGQACGGKTYEVVFASLAKIKMSKKGG